MANPVKNPFPEMAAGVDFTCFVDIHTYQQPVDNPGIRASVCLPVSPVEKIFFAFSLFFRVRVSSLQTQLYCAITESKDKKCVYERNLSCRTIDRLLYLCYDGS